jgi:23S rRNA pseudouridine2605 synthase
MRLMTQERLQKLMAQAGMGSRRHCESVISAGRVQVNGIIAHLGQRANLEQDVITIDGKELQVVNLTYIKLYKPKGVLSSTADELGANRTTIIDLVDFKGHLYPVGRLDKQSEGLILLTNDGPLTNRLTHPRYGHSKVYEVIIEGRVSEDVLIKWRRGILLDGIPTAPADIKVIGVNQNQTRLKVTLREGRKRQIRRVAALLGYEVIGLIRRQIGPISLGDLGPGQWIRLSDDEVKALHESAFNTSKKQMPR